MWFARHFCWGKKASLVVKMCCVSTYQVHEVQREYVDAAGHSGQSADDGGENAETTCAEQKVLQRKTHSEN